MTSKTLLCIEKLHKIATFRDIYNTHIMNAVEYLLVTAHIHICTHTHTHSLLSATLPVILCCCHSNHLTFPSQSRPNETTGGQTESERESSKGVEERYRHREKERYIRGKIGRMEAELPLSCISSLHTRNPLCRLARILLETKATALPATSTDYTVSS